MQSPTKMFHADNPFTTFNGIADCIRIKIKLKEVILFKFWTKESLSNDSFLILRSLHIGLNKWNQRQITYNKTNLIRNNPERSLPYSKFVFLFFFSLFLLLPQNQLDRPTFYFISMNYLFSENFPRHILWIYGKLLFG